MHKNKDSIETKELNFSKLLKFENGTRYCKTQFNCLRND